MENFGACICNSANGTSALRTLKLSNLAHLLFQVALLQVPAAHCQATSFNLVHLSGTPKQLSDLLLTAGPRRNLTSKDRAVPGVPLRSRRSVGYFHSQLLTGNRSALPREVEVPCANSWSSRSRHRSDCPDKPRQAQPGKFDKPLPPSHRAQLFQFISSHLPHFHTTSQPTTHKFSRDRLLNRPIHSQPPPTPVTPSIWLLFVGRLPSSYFHSQLHFSDRAHFPPPTWPLVPVLESLLAAR
jgi:hypothetical protein